MGCSLPVSSIPGIFQARVLELGDFQPSRTQSKVEGSKWLLENFSHRHSLKRPSHSSLVLCLRPSDLSSARPRTCCSSQALPRGCTVYFSCCPPCSHGPSHSGLLDGPCMTLIHFLALALLVPGTPVPTGAHGSFKSWSQCHLSPGHMAIAFWNS